MLRLTEEGRVLVSALTPSVEELADRAQEAVLDLRRGEAMQVGHVARRLMWETIERALEAGEDGNQLNDQAPRGLGEVVDDLAAVCISEAIRVLAEHDGGDGREGR